jgi:hypothetical protein
LYAGSPQGLALVAFLLKIGATYSRGAFVLFYILTPVVLLGARKAAKVALSQAIAQGAIGRGDGYAPEERLAGPLRCADLLNRTVDLT